MIKLPYYTGVGSRKTPKNILTFMTEIATHLNELGYILRSGGAKGADTAFERGSEDVEIYYASDCTLEAEKIAERFHPAWNLCSPFVKKLHGRNAFQILGLDLNTPSRFLICWTPDACTCHADRTIRTGGTGTAISIADSYNVKIFNLAVPSHADRLSKI